MMRARTFTQVLAKFDEARLLRSKIKEAGIKSLTGGFGVSSQYETFLGRLMSTLYQPEGKKGKVADVAQVGKLVQSSVGSAMAGITGGFFSSAVSLLSGGGPQPHDRPVLVIFVVGGMTGGEMREVSQCLGRHRGTEGAPAVQVIMGSNTLATPSGVCAQVLGLP